MYVKQRPEGFLADRDAIAVWLDRSVNTIRKHCTPVDRLGNGTPVYNMEHCALVLAKVPERRAARR